METHGIARAELARTDDVAVGGWPDELNDCPQALSVVHLMQTQGELLRSGFSGLDVAVDHRDPHPFEPIKLRGTWYRCDSMHVGPGNCHSATVQPPHLGRPPAEIEVHVHT